MQLEAVEGFLSGEVNRYDLCLKMITLAPLEKVNWRRQRWVLGNGSKAINSGPREKVCDQNPSLGSG